MTLVDHKFPHLNRYWHRYAACPVCGVEEGDMCWDQRFYPGKAHWRKTLKPHADRPRRDGQPRSRKGS